MAETYKMTIAGLERELPVCQLNDKTDIAAFVLFSDVELTVAAAEKLLSKSPYFDMILTAESKGIPLAYEMARASGKPYVVARKSVKFYMTDPMAVKVKSLTTADEQTLYLSKEKAAMLKGKKVLIVDDVISTGESLHALEQLVKEAGGIISGRSAIIAEGQAAERKDICFLEKLPLFSK